MKEDNSIYNIHLKRVITINECERFCKKCKGRGKVRRDTISSIPSIITLVCDECLGDGKIDWIEEVVGKLKPIKSIEV